MSHQEETAAAAAAAPPQRQRRGGRLVERILIITICFGILSLLNLEPLARNSVQNHNSKLFDLPQTDNDSVGIIQHFQSSKALPSKFSNDAAPSVAAVELVGSKEGGGEPVAAPPIQIQKQTSLSLHSQNVHFRTYGTDDYAWAKGRSIQEALDTGWFASVKALGPDDLTAEFKKTFDTILKLRRGGGYWIWKYDVIEQTLEEMKEGDFLVYLDAGSKVNKDGEERFRQYLKIVNESQYDMLCFQYPHAQAEYIWTTEKIFRAFNISKEDPIRLSGQIEGGTLLMQKGPHLRRWLKIVKDAILQDPWIITDKYNHETKDLTRDFRDNRHDQSLSSVSRKIHGCEMISSHESNSRNPNKPFHVMRMKKPPRLKNPPPQGRHGDDSNVKFCGSNKWLGAPDMTCEEKAQLLVSRSHMSEQNAKSTLLVLEGGCQCNAQQKPKSNIGVSLIQPLASRNEGICTFCMGGVFNRGTVVPGTGGKTCGSIMLMAAGEVNGSDICATIQKEERVCCRGTNKNESAVGLSKEEGDTLVEVPRFNSSLTSWNISAIIPTCNRLHSLQDAIESALKQTYPVLEVIVSIDSGPSCVKSIKNIWESKDDRVRVVKVPPCPQNPCGLGRNRNYAIEQASPYATHFALLDDDDVWYPQKTEIQVKAMQEEQYLYASSDANAPRNGRCHGSEYKSHDLEKGSFFLANGGVHKKIISKKLNISLDAKLPSHVTRKELSTHNIFIASATIFSKDIFYATSGFDERIDKMQEYRLWLDFAKISPGLFITDPLVVYDINRNGCDITYTSDLYDDGPLDSQVEWMSLKKKLIPCEMTLSQPLQRRCNPYDNITNTSSTHLFIYNPSVRDKFLCNAKLIIGPKRMKPLTYDDINNKCGGGNDLMPEIAFRSHSFPRPPTMENRHQFPGILIENREKNEIPTKQIVASLRSQFSTTRNASKKLMGMTLDDTFSSNAIATKEKTPRPPKMYGYYLDDSFSSEEDTVFSNASAQCDIKCAAEPSSGGTVFQQYVYGTDWLFTFSIEGEKKFPVKVDENAWKRNEFYGTTSFKSEIPRTYDDAIELLTVGIPADKFPPVNYATAIKGASFLARNCRSNNYRETMVKEIIEAAFRVDSLSGCLHNAEPPEGVMASASKSEIMRRYLFHLAFENQNTDDYITEKLWLTLQSGTVPVYLGAPNIGEHFFPNHSFINVNDFSTTQELAGYLIKVANDETLYNSYHVWRKEPLPKSFLEKHLPVLGRNNCRLCRWAHARKYGLGWNHEQQVIKPIALSREACVDNAGLIRSPAVESWWEMGGEGLASKKVKSSSSNESSFTTTCSMNEEVATMTIEGDFSRSVWSRDGTTDILLQGESSKSLMLRLAFPMKHHKPLLQLNSHTAWIQNELSRISFVVVDGNGHGAARLVSSAESGFVSIEVKPSSLPLRIRIIIEDYDCFHKGADQYQTYYGQIMEEDVWIHPQLFALKVGESIDIDPSDSASMIRDTIDAELAGFASEHDH